MAYTLLYAIELLFRFLEYAIIADVILSFIVSNRNNEFIRILHIFTEPFMIPGRKLQERLAPGLMIDFSPIIALMILSFLQKLIYVLIRIAFNG